MKSTVNPRYHVKIFATTPDGSFDRAIYEFTLPAANGFAALSTVLHSLPARLTIHTIEVCPDV